MINHIKEIVPKFLKNKKGLGAFNTFNLEITKAIIEAAGEMKAAAVVQVSEKAIVYAGLPQLFNIIKTEAEQNPKAKIAIHLDHGKDIELIKKCVDIGFSSVQFDGSELPYEKNIELTRKVVAYAHAKGAWVQGEVGIIFGKEGLVKLKDKKIKQFSLTDPDQARDFAKKTGVDSLAISVGTLHGQFKGIEKLDLLRIKKIRQATGSLPLVLHGCSGLALSDLKQATRLGLTIFNLDTTLRIAFTNKLKSVLLKKADLVDPRIYLGEAKKAARSEVRKYLQALNSII
jgi:fructose-bisphosphate aldolase, class II